MERYIRMERDGYQRSLWQDTVTNEVHGQETLPTGLFDAVIIGAGITGITTVHELQRAGLRCAVVEARTIAFGTTGGTTAHLNTVLDTTYDRIERSHGRTAARLVATGLLEALELLRANARAHAPDCTFTELDSFTFSQNEKETEMLLSMMESGIAAGIPMEPVGRLPIQRGYHAVLKVPAQASFHPGRYVHGVARAFVDAGGMLFEGLRCTAVEEATNGSVVRTERGELHARRVVHATHVPPGVNILHFRCAPYRSYALAAKLTDQGAYPDALIYDLEDPYHYYRTQVIDGQPFLIVGGEDHKSGHEENTNARFRALEEHARKYFPVREITHEWSSQYFESADGLPYIGKLPGGHVGVHCATGFGGNGMMLGTLAAMVLRDMFTSKGGELATLFDPGRVSMIAGFANMAKEAADVVGHFIKKPFLPERIPDVDALGTNEGRLVRLDGRAIGMFKDRQGRLHAVDPACSHVNCTVAWNAAERSWDCPCHGSRFDVDGHMLTGPARKDLQQLDPGK